MTLRTAIHASILFAMPLMAVDPARDRDGLVAHEWGTFTSIANENGRPVRWAPLLGTADLPCFVANLGSPRFKERAWGTVRMETPVIYFYTPQPATLSVNVAFPKGWITEWYPAAAQVTPASPGDVAPPTYTNGSIWWDRVEAVPGAVPTLRSTRGASHHFAARETDSAPLRVGEQWEKLLFYRGVADFQIPLRPVFINTGRTVRITNSGSEPVSLAILFENRAGKIGYRIFRSLGEPMEIDMPELNGSLETLRGELVQELTAFGLFEKEALAMVETWRDSWFEEGTRLFYLVPRATVDALLPLEIKPAPASVARVFVGRIDMLSPATRQVIQTASAAGDRKRLARFGRFLGPWVIQMERENPGSLRSPAVQSIFQQAWQGAGCVQ